MANEKISGLGAASALAGGELFEVVQVGANKKATISQVRDYIIATVTTTNIDEGSNLYFTEARVRATPLTGLSVSGGAVVAGDTVIVGFGKLQNQMNDKVSLTGSYADPAWITSLAATKLTGTVPIGNLPAAALERIYVYTGAQTLPENAGLTTGQVQNGDVVKMNTNGTTPNGLMYVVADDANLNLAASFVQYNAGFAAAVPWTGLTGTPLAWMLGSGGTLTAPNTVTLSASNTLTFTGGRVTFTPNSTNSGLNIGSIGTSPHSNKVMGDLYYYDTGSNNTAAPVVIDRDLTPRYFLRTAVTANGSQVPYFATAGGTSVITSSSNFTYDGATWSVTGVSNFVSSGSGNTALTVKAANANTVQIFRVADGANGTLFQVQGGGVAAITTIAGSITLGLSNPLTITTTSLQTQGGSTLTLNASNNTAVGNFLTVGTGLTVTTGNVTMTNGRLAISNSSAFTANNQSAVSIGGSASFRATSGDTASDLLFSHGVTTASTNQTYKNIGHEITYTINHTGASVYGNFISYSFAGSQQPDRFVAYHHNGGFVQWASVLSPAQLTSDQNDYNPTGWTNGGAPYGASILRLDSNSAVRVLTGIAGGVDGRLAIGGYVGSASNTVAIVSESASSTAANRYLIPATFLPEKDEFWLQFYDGASSRWRITGVHWTFSSTQKGLVPKSGGGTTNFLRADGAWSAPSAGIGGSTGSIDNRILRSDGTGGATIQNSSLGIDDSGNLIDTNTNELVKFTATASAVNEVTITNAATGNPPIISATGGDGIIALELQSKGSTGTVRVTNNGFTWVFGSDNANSYHTLSVVGTSKISASVQVILQGDSSGVVLSSASQTGATSSGNIQIVTGDVVNGTSGNIFIWTGAESGTGHKGNISLHGDYTVGFGGGEGVTYIRNCYVAPASNPSAGGLLYVESGALKYRGSSGTTTTIANA